MLFLEGVVLKDKIMLVAGVGSGKLVPIIFGFYLARQFDGDALVYFVLVLTYGAALSALSNMGSAPRIIRSGVHGDPDGFVFEVVGVSFLIAGLTLLLSTIYWFFVADGPFINVGGMPFLSQIWVALYSLGLVMFTLAQSIFNVKGDYRVTGVYALILHVLAGMAGIIAGELGDVGLAVSGYFIAYFLGSLIFFAASRRRLVRSSGSITAWHSIARLWSGVRGAISASLFGVITLAGLYLFVHSVQRELSTADAATFALGLQLFQAGVFLPSVLGGVVVPRMVAAGRFGKDDPEALHRSTRALYFGIGLGWLFVSLFLARPLLSLYDLDSAGAAGLVLIQVAAALAGLQAYFVQRLVAVGRFNLLAVASLVWAFAGYVALLLVPPSLFGAASALVVAYVVCLLFYLVCSPEPRL
ncbi:hypothetical protein [Pseudomonas sp. sia0905]|uniref:hypothetical protein n=1 Tax=Pseudomonas sp. sia0905 TaxID=2854783 RepID=UPI001C4717F5|nr:hypothetical protein [Pseudomonas sp. sia0905]MBV7562419.1 hypothetical protein [Pseudomonas sp. sia0905]